MVLVERAVRRRRCGPHGVPSKGRPSSGSGSSFQAMSFLFPVSAQRTDRRQTPLRLRHSGPAAAARTAADRAPRARCSGMRRPSCRAFRTPSCARKCSWRPTDGRDGARRPFATQTPIVQSRRAPAQSSSILERKAGILFGLHQRMRGTDTVTRPAWGLRPNPRTRTAHSRDARPRLFAGPRQ